MEKPPNWQSINEHCNSRICLAYILIYIFVFFLLLGSLIKLVYFSRHEENPSDNRRKRAIKQRFGVSNVNRRSYPILGGRLHFVKFETGKLNECLDFISSKQLHHGGM